MEQTDSEVLNGILGMGAHARLTFGKCKSGLEERPKGSAGWQTPPILKIKSL